jgi:hypothetical protein
MESSGEVTIVISAESASKLAELAGGDSETGNYLAWLIQKLYLEQQGRGGLVDTDFILRETHKLLEKREYLQERFLAVEDRLDKIASRQNELAERANKIATRLRRRANPTE